VLGIDLSAFNCRQAANETKHSKARRNQRAGGMWHVASSKWGCKGTQKRAF